MCKPLFTASMSRRRACAFMLRPLRLRLVRVALLLVAIVVLNAALCNMTLLITSTASVRVVQKEWRTSGATLFKDMCGALMRADSADANATHELAYAFMRDNRTAINVPAERYLVASCDEITAGLGVPYSYVVTNQDSKEFESPEDFDFQIAYSLNAFKQPFQIERLLRAIYRPQHLYCIHVDPKADPYTTAVMAELAACFPNVFLPTQRATVYWGTFSVLEADLICMEELYNRSSTWRYWINLTGQEFPLKTNAELVRALKALNGANAMEATRRRVPESVWDQFFFRDMRKLGVVPTKGAVSVVVSRQFVNFALHNRVARAVLEIIRRNVTYPSPSELFFTSLNFNPQIGTPGAYLGEPETSEVHPYFNRLKDWGAPPFSYGCKSGLRVRLICIWGVKDLPLLTDVARRELFVNKLYLDFERLTLDCLESWFWSRTLADVQTGSKFDASYYAQLHMARNHVPLSLAHSALNLSSSSAL